MLNGFDRIAWFYDFLARLVYQNAIVDSQTAFLHIIPGKAKVLILGGGTGWIIECVLDAQPDCEIVFIDASAKMIALAKRRAIGRTNVEFIHGTERDMGSRRFDVLLTPFFLDMFTERHLGAVVSEINSSLNPGTQWIVADFCSQSKFWQRAMLRMMYTFFRLTTHIEARTLPDWKQALKLGGWNEFESKKFYGDFITASVFRRR